MDRSAVRLTIWLSHTYRGQLYINEYGTANGFVNFPLFARFFLF